MSHDRGPQHVSGSLDRLLGSMDAPPVDVLSAVFSRWPEIVGADLAQHCRPSAIDGDRLVITASDPTWASELRWLEQQVLERVAEVAGAARLSRVLVRVDRHRSGGSGW